MEELEYGTGGGDIRTGEAEEAGRCSPEWASQGR